MFKPQIMRINGNTDFTSYVLQQLLSTNFLGIFPDCGSNTGKEITVFKIYFFTCHLFFLNSKHRIGLNKTFT